MAQINVGSNRNGSVTLERGSAREEISATDKDTVVAWLDGWLKGETMQALRVGSVGFEADRFSVRVDFYGNPRVSVSVETQEVSRILKWMK